MQAPSRPAYGQAQASLPTPILAIKNAICFSCFQQTPKLDRCSACRRVAYCSKKCQTNDWKDGHKKTCKILVASNKRKSPTYAAFRSWEVFRTEKASLIRDM